MTGRSRVTETVSNGKKGQRKVDTKSKGNEGSLGTSEYMEGADGTQDNQGETGDSRS